MNILFLKRGAIGDILMTTPLVRQIKQLYPDAKIDYCVSQSCKIALCNNIYVDNLIALPDVTFSVKGIFSFIKFLYSIRNNYDYVFILGKNFLVNLFCRVILKSILVGFARDKISKYLLHNYVVYNNVNKYQVLYYLDLLSISGLGVANYDNIIMDLITLNVDQNIVQDLLYSLSIEKFIVVTNSGGNNKFENNGIRMLPEDKVIELLRYLLKHNKVILLGGEVDWVNYDQYIKTLNFPTKLINLAGKLTLSQSTYLLSLANYFYVTDCGVMHLGFIAGIESKMTCFFGPTNPKHIIPNNAKCKVVWNDTDIFNESYQLYGKIEGVGKKYFQRLKIDEVI